MEENDIRVRKSELRKEVLARREALPPEERRKKSTTIHTLLFSLPEFRIAQIISLFVSFKSEVITESMIRGALAMGKVVAVPVTDLRTRALTFSRIIDYPGDLYPGTWGIPEPKPGCFRPLALEKIELMVVPGAVFDCQGNRIGYGGGFYDRVIRASKGSSLFVALAFELQVVDRVPTDRRYDEPVDVIITEMRVIHCRRNRDPSCTPFH